MRICLSCSREFAGPDWKCPTCACHPETIDGFLAFAPELALQEAGFPKDSFEDLLNLESGNFWFRSRSKLLFWALRKYFPSARTFLEIGCGTGYVLMGIEREFPELALSGSEVQTAGLLRAAMRLKRSVLFQMDARRIPFANDFDVVGCFDVLEHIPDDNLALRQIYGAVRPGGGALIAVPQHPSLWGPDDEYAHHVRRYTAPELKDKLAAAGFRLRLMTSFVSLLLPALYASRFIRRRNAASYDPAGEFKIGAAANWLLERVLDLERAFISAGVRFPAGGSLLAVAEKPDNHDQ